MFNFVFLKLKLSYQWYQKLHLASIRKGVASKGVFETLVEVAGIEPASRNLSDLASTCVVLLLILA